MPRSLRSEYNGELVITSFHLPRRDYEELVRMVREGYFPSIAEAVRYALRRLLYNTAQDVRIPVGMDVRKNDVFARVVCENGHVVALMRANSVSFSKRVRALRLADLVCPVCRSSNLFIELTI